MRKKYCVYTDQFHDVKDMTPEHVIPLSLGGTNKFCIDVNSEKNKILGSKIDGKMSNDYLVSCIRRKNDFKGHSNQSPLTKLTNVKMKETGKPVQLIFGKNINKVYDLIEKRDLTREETVGKNFQIKISMDKHIRSLFVTKTALAAGYFIYGKTFIENSDHDSLRSYMEFSNHSDMSLVENLNLRFIDQFTDAEDKQTVLTKKYFTLLFKELNCSSVKFALCSEHFIVSVAIGGEYIGSVNFKANTGKFPNQDKFSGGQVIGIQDGCLKRSSLDFIEETIRKKYRPN